MTTEEPRITRQAVYQVRLDGIEQAASRARKIFFGTTVLSLTVVACCFNAYVSWLRLFGHVGFVPGPKEVAMTKYLREQLLRNWVDSTFVTVPLLGSKLSVSDVAVWGTSALCVVALWLYFCMRRENHLIAYALADAYHDATKHKDEQLYRLVVHGVRATQVFSTGNITNVPYRSMAMVHEQREVQRKSQSTEKSPRRLLGLTSLPGLVVVGLMSLPTLACVAVITADLLSIMVVPALFRGSENAIGFDELLKAPRLLAHFTASTVFAIGMLIACGFLGRSAGRYQLATRALVEETIGRLMPEHWAERLGGGGGGGPQPLGPDSKNVAVASNATPLFVGENEGESTQELNRVGEGHSKST